MVQKFISERRFFQAQSERLFYPRDPPAIKFPIKNVEIDWDWLIAKRPVVLDTIESMPVYLLKPEVLKLLSVEMHPTYRLILDLMWTTGACISEVLGLTRSSFIDDGYSFGVILKTLQQHSGRPRNSVLKHSPKHYVPIKDPILQDRLVSFLIHGQFTKYERIFPMARQTVNRHIHALIEKVGGAPFKISSYTFRHSFAIHLLLHGCPLKYISNLLGNQSIESALIYNNVLNIDCGHFLEGVDFH